MREMNDPKMNWSKMLVEPHPAVIDPQQRQSAHVLAGLTLALVGAKYPGWRTLFRLDTFRGQYFACF